MKLKHIIYLVSSFSYQALFSQPWVSFEYCTSSLNTFNKHPSRFNYLARIKLLHTSIIGTNIYTNQLPMTVSSGSLLLL